MSALTATPCSAPPHRGAASPAGLRENPVKRVLNRMRDQAVPLGDVEDVARRLALAKECEITIALYATRMKFHVAMIFLLPNLVDREEAP